MAKTVQDVSLKMKASFLDSISKTNLRKATAAAAAEAIKIMKDRTASGYDTQGRRFGHYNYEYRNLKKSFVGGGRGRALAKLRSRKTGEAANKVNDYLRLTGELFSDMAARVESQDMTNGRINAKFMLYIKARSAKKAEGLMATTGRNKYVSYSKKSFKFFGLSTTGTRRKNEMERLKLAFIKALKVKSSRVTGFSGATK